MRERAKESRAFTPMEKKRAVGRIIEDDVKVMQGRWPPWRQSTGCSQRRQEFVDAGGLLARGELSRNIPSAGYFIDRSSGAPAGRSTGGAADQVRRAAIQAANLSHQDPQSIWCARPGDRVRNARIPH